MRVSQILVVPVKAGPVSGVASELLIYPHAEYEHPGPALQLGPRVAVDPPAPGREPDGASDAVIQDRDQGVEEVADPALSLHLQLSQGHIDEDQGDLLLRVEALELIESLNSRQSVRYVIASVALLKSHIVQVKRLVLRNQGGSEAGEDTGVQASGEEDTHSCTGTLLTGS